MMVPNPGIILVHRSSLVGRHRRRASSVFLPDQMRETIMSFAMPVWVSGTGWHTLCRTIHTGPELIFMDML